MYFECLWKSKNLLLEGFVTQFWNQLSYKTSDLARDKYPQTIVKCDWWIVISRFVVNNFSNKFPNKRKIN